MSHHLDTQAFANHSTERTDGPSTYVVRQARKSQQGQDDLKAVETTKTLYAGNLSFFTTEEQIYELFSKAGQVTKIIMGLDRFNKTPCGFCFVEYSTHEEALFCVRYLNLTKLDDRVIRVDLDPGFKEGRQFGRGMSGGQVRDEFREDYDPGRGGYGRRWAQAAQNDVMAT
ncbi:nuclear cap-binding protein subunit 2 [Trichomonascus vanleenenianus]|uniref:nuclear cap-binding protein subunit CBC2 n=1 Tax=Trichomonascus vanleenenianus TaxID=2268995 RepID=UPI003EC99A70